jgi:hypothetical protein
MDRSDDESWMTPTPETVIQMSTTIKVEKLVAPKIPRWMQHDLRVSTDGWAWSTSSKFNSWAVYALYGEAGPRQLEEMVSDDQPDFLMFGHRGYGMNSYGFGIVARVGPIFISQQHGWGGVYMDEKQSRAALNSGIRVWNRTATMVAPLIAEPLRVAITYSSYRGYAQLLTLGQHDLDVESSQQSRRGGFDLKDWSLVTEKKSPNFGDDLRSLRRGNDRALAVAASHLSRLVR